MSKKKSILMSNEDDNLGWNSALRDAEEGLKLAKKDVSKWESVIKICRDRVKEDAEWPKVSGT